MTQALRQDVPVATVIDGKRIASEVQARVADGVAAFRAEQGYAPALAVVLVGDDPASALYVRRKAEQCRALGMASHPFLLPADVGMDMLLGLIERLNGDDMIHGILVQLPLPAHLDTPQILAAVSPAKDVDGFHMLNAGMLASGVPGMVPCTPLGCLKLLRETGIELRGKNALVIGCSVIVGRPMAQLLLMEDCTVTIAHRHTRDLAALCRQAEILVVATGVPGLVRGEWIRPGAIVLDVGINRLPPTEARPKGRIVGDVAYDEAVHVAGAITPVPGGVGPMTIACLLENTLTAANRLAGRRSADDAALAGSNDL